MNSRSLYAPPDGSEMRWINPENPTGEKGKGGQTNGGRKGNPCYGKLAAGAQLTLADYSGTPGIVRHIWTTIDNRSPLMLRGLRMEFYWDGAADPAISAPYGDFFGLGLGQMTPFESAVFTSPEGRNFNSHLPMPFRRGFRIAVKNETDRDLAMFWFHVGFTINDPFPENPLYCHAFFRRQRATAMQEDYEFLPRVEGKGRYLGANFGVIANRKLYFNSWWGEGECKIYVDGDTRYPTLCGTGTEDYICDSWGQQKFVNLRYGCPIADLPGCRFGFYRYHTDDPIYFRRDIRCAIQQIGCWEPDTILKMHGSGVQLRATGPGAPAVDMAAAARACSYGLFEREADDWSSCAYFYLDSPVNRLPALQPVAERTEGLG